ncbi:hypothetical protein BB561_004268 [Smittium simulii]|uniref:Uncharacterized protein n=1 Tax=Smittium simulii TaxID=133385 RepID=A0A2T9YH81_9FUNG|nr:hypothetical protein BB561_004268 [Smittium simulii]
MEDQAKKRKARLEQLRNVRQRSLIKTIDAEQELDQKPIENTVEAKVEGLAEASINELKEIREAEELDIAKVVQTKPDADMKRLLQSKLDNLENQNQTAFFTLLKDRLENGKKLDNLAESVAIQGYLESK